MTVRVFNGTSSGSSVSHSGESIDWDEEGKRMRADKKNSKTYAGQQASYYVVDEMKTMNPDEALRINVAETVSGARLPRWEKLARGIPMSSGQETRRVRTYAVSDYNMRYVRNDRQKPVQRWCEVAQHMTGDRVCIHTYQDWKDWQNYGSLQHLWWKNFTDVLWGLNSDAPEDPKVRAARKLSMENFTATWLDSTNKSW